MGTRARRNSKVDKKSETSKKFGHVEFIVEIHADGRWTAESKNVDGIITGGMSVSEIDEMLKDAILTYFEVPRRKARSYIFERQPVIYRERFRFSPNFMSV